MNYSRKPYRESNDCNAAEEMNATEEIKMNAL